MKLILLGVLVTCLSGCGVETAATVGAAKAKEAEEAKKTLANVRKQIDGLPKTATQ